MRRSWLIPHLHARGKEMTYQLMFPDGRKEIALRVPTYPSAGFITGLKGFTAAVIGGIGSIPGAMAGGLILGLAEAYTQGYISTKWSDLAVFVILILIMLFRPQGLFGRPDITKV